MILRVVTLFASVAMAIGLSTDSCPCFFGMWLTPNGLGNRVAEIIAGQWMADELGWFVLALCFKRKELIFL